MPPSGMIEQVIEAGLYAPSGMGRQSAIVVSVTDKELRNRLSQMNAVVGGWKPDFDPFYGAPVILIVLANRDIPTFVYDGSLVMGNLMLAAHSLGIGSCWIHRAKEVFDSEEGKAILQSIGIHGNYEGIGHCILGFIDSPLPKSAPRKQNRVFYVN